MTDLPEEFIAEQQRITEAYLDELPGRVHYRRGVKEALAVPWYDLAVRAGGWLYARRHGAGAQPSLVRAREVHQLDTAEVVFDPVSYDEGSVALVGFQVSTCGLVATIVSVGRSRAHTVLVQDPSRGAVVDAIRGVRGATVHWSGDGTSLYYPGDDLTAGGGGSSGGALAWSLRRHVVGDDQDGDPVVLAPGAAGRTGPRIVRLLGGGEGWVIAARDSGPKSPNEVLAIEDAPGAVRPPRILVPARSGHWRWIGMRKNVALMITDHGAPHGRVVGIDVPSGAAREIVPEISGRALLRGVAARTCVALKYTVEGAQEVDVRALDGRLVERVPLGDHVSVSYVGASAGDDRVYCTVSSMFSPPLLHEIVPGPRGVRTTRGAAPRALPRVEGEVVRIRATSADGTVVPALLIRRCDAVPGPTPTVLMAYGGFGVALRPGFSPMLYPWLCAGGAVVLAHVRGGGELGREWHEAAVRHTRHRSFEDLYAVAQELVDLGLTSPSQLALHGRSNGGLLAAVAMLQQPRLWGAVLPSAGIYDMLEFHRSGLGAAWIEEFGDPDNPVDRDYLRGYSPLHNVRPGRSYPPCLISVGALDDLVPAAHSYRFASALQALAVPGRPALLMVAATGGHGSGDSTDELVAEYGDQLAFAAHFTGLGLPGTTAPPEAQIEADPRQKAPA